MERRPWFVAYLALGCSSGSLDEPQGSGGQAPVCEVPDHTSSAEPASVGSVEATIVDLDANPVTGILVQVCGLDLCIPGETDSQGYAVVSGGEMKLPAFKYGDGLTHAKIALLLDAPIESLDLGQLTLPALPAEGAAIAAGSTASSAGAELAVPSGASVTFDRLTYRTADEQAFRAAELPLALVPDGLDPGLGFELFYALGPIETEFCPPAELALPNGPGFEPGVEVEFYVHGLNVEELHAPYGGFAYVSDGVVSEDGSVVRTSTGGLPLLSLVAVRRKE